MDSIWRFISFTMNFDLDFTKANTFTHAWSLCVEEHFYILLPVILLLSGSGRQRPWLWLGFPFLVLAGMLLRFFIYQHFLVHRFSEPNFAALWYTDIYYPSYCRLDGLICGVAIAAVFFYKPVWKAVLLGFGNVCLFAGLILLAVSMWLFNGHFSIQASVFGFPTIAIAFSLLLVSVISPQCFLSKIPSWVFSSLAALSYSLYLVHKIVIHAVQQLAQNAGLDDSGTPVFILSVIASLGVALLLRNLIEKPFLRLKSKFKAV